VDHQASDALLAAAKSADHPRTPRPISDLGSHQPDRQGDGPTHPHPAPNHQRVQAPGQPQVGSHRALVHVGEGAAPSTTLSLLRLLALLRRGFGSGTSLDFSGICWPSRATWASTSLRGEAGRATSAERLTRSRWLTISPDLDQWSPEVKPSWRPSKTGRHMEAVLLSQCPMRQPLTPDGSWQHFHASRRSAPPRWSELAFLPMEFGTWDWQDARRGEITNRVVKKVPEIALGRLVPPSVKS